MSVKSVLAELEKLGTAQNRKIYARHGANEPMLGVSYANFGKLSRRIKTDHNLALALWDSGVHDARVLAMRIADATNVKASELDHWCKSLDSSLVADELGSFVAKTKFAETRAAKWSESTNAYRSVAGWRIVTSLAKEGDVDEAFFLPYLDTIESDIHTRKNDVRDAMNWALIAIGCRNAPLEKRALAVAKAIGKVEVDHGETNCQTKDAAAYIRKTRDHYAKKKKNKRSQRCD